MQVYHYRRTTDVVSDASMPIYHLLVAFPPFVKTECYAICRPSVQVENMNVKEGRRKAM